MTDALLVPFTIHGSGVHVTRFTNAINIQFPPPELPEGVDSFSCDDWRIGPDGTLMLARIPGGARRVEHMRLQGLDASSHGAPLVPSGPLDHASELQLQGRMGTPVETAPVTVVGDADWHAVWWTQVTPERWVQLGDDGLIVALDGDGVLAAIYVHAPVAKPQERRIRLDGTLGWQAQVNDWRDASGANLGTGIALQRTIEPFTWDEQGESEHLAGFDQMTYLVLTGGNLQHLDLPASPGSIEVPVADEAVTELELTVTWPTDTISATTETHGDGTAHALVTFGIDADRWVSVGDGLVAGVSADDVLAAIYIAHADDASMHGGFIMGPDDMHEAPDHDAMMANMLVSMQHQFEGEQALARQWAKDRPFAAYGPADAPVDGPRSLRLPNSGVDDETSGVELVWGDDFGRMLPDGDRDAPVVTVTHERILEAFMPDEPTHDDHLHWLHGQQMLHSQWNMPHDGALPDLADSGVWGPEAHERAVKELAAQAEPASLIIDGASHDGTVIRTDFGFVARADVADGWRVVVRSTQADGAVPQLVTIDDVDAFLDGQRREHERHVQMHEEAIAQSGAADAAAPAAAIAMRDAAQRIERAITDPASYADDIVAGWSGADSFAQRMHVTAQLVHVQANTVGVARDGSVASLLVHCHLPRPDGTGVGIAVGVPFDWWDYDAEQLRAEASVQPTREQQGEYELRFHALVERREDGSYVLTTDLLRLIDEQVGGVEQLLR